jgi:hypothetical protein
MRTIIWLGGGVSAGTGLLLAALYGFGLPGGDISAQISQIGFDGLLVVGITPVGWAALTMIFVGAWMMIKASATAWKQTGGY